MHSRARDSTLRGWPVGTTYELQLWAHDDALGWRWEPLWDGQLLVAAIARLALAQLRGLGTVRLTAHWLP